MPTDTNDAPPLVPGRDCGECAVCCTVLIIDKPDIRKVSGVTCRYCKGGCTIHETRFDICRDYYCGWRTMPWLDDSARPDKSGILVSVENAEIPAGYENRGGIRLMVLRGDDTVLQRGFLRAIMTLVARRVPVQLSIPGPNGAIPPMVFLNNGLADAVAAGDEAWVARLLLQAMAVLRGHDFVPYVFQNGPQGMSEPQNAPESRQT